MAATHQPAIVAVPNNDPSQPARPDKAPSNARLPSLNQLAARINANPPLVSNQSSRPRLAASVLRTGSTVSLATSATSNTTDSLAVNASSTRAGSPSADESSRASSPAASSTSGATNGTGDYLTKERLEKHNADGEKKQHKIGYKNIPSLEEITVRMAMARTLSIDGSSKPPEPETIEDPKTPGVPQKVPEHPLQQPWTIYHDTKAKMPTSAGPTGETSPNNPHPPVTESGIYEAGLTVIGEFDSVESFCRYFNWLKPPSRLDRNSNYHLFKVGIKPMWEDPANANGGKWVLTMKGAPQLLDRCWSWLTMAMVGEELDEGDEVCGAVVSLRSKVDRIQLWIRSKDDVERINSIGRKLIKLLDVSEADGIGLEFQYNSDDRPPPNRFISIQASFPQSSFRSTFPNQGEGGPPNPPGLAFGAFGTGSTFGGSSGWRARRT